MRVVQIPLAYPLHYKRLLTFTTFPALNTLHSIQFLPHHAVHHRLHPDQYTDAYLLVQWTVTLQTTPQYAQTALMMKKKISRWYLWMMNTGLLRKHLKELYVFINMVYHMDYASTHVLLQTMKLFPTWTVWIEVTFLTMRIIWLHAVMRRYPEWRKYHADVELWFA